MDLARCGRGRALSAAGLGLPDTATEVLLVRHGASQDAIPGEPFEMVEATPIRRCRRSASSRPRWSAHAWRPTRRTRCSSRPCGALVQTAAPLVAATGLEPTVIPSSQEVHLGEWEGGELRIRTAHGDPLVRTIFEEQRWDVIRARSRWRNCGAHVAASCASSRSPARAASRPPSSTAVSSASSTRQATSAPRLSFIHAENTSIAHIIVFADGRWLLRSFNDTSHL